MGVNGATYRLDWCIMGEGGALGKETNAVSWSMDLALAPTP